MNKIVQRDDGGVGAQLSAMATAMKAGRILVIGNGALHASIWLARALPVDGLLIVLGIDAALAGEARGHFERAGLSDRASVITGDPGRMLHKIAGPFDVIVLAAGPKDNPPMRGALASLLGPGGRLIALGENGSLTASDGI